MTYRELLDKCKKTPGLFSTNKQMKIDNTINYNKWVDDMNRKYSENKDIKK